jgi:integrase
VSWSGVSPKKHRDRAVVIPRILADELAGRIDGDELIFTSPDGHPLRTPNILRRVWRPAVAECDLGDLVPHDLRHTAASLAISAGASVKAVQRMLGHASAQITLDRYSHLYDDDLEDLADSVDARYRAAQPESGEVFPIQKRRK